VTLFSPAGAPVPTPAAFATRTRVAFPAHEALMNRTDPISDALTTNCPTSFAILKGRASSADIHLFSGIKSAVRAQNSAV
jgi:hypothetical protein